jgi:hypothetical protein
MPVTIENFELGQLPLLTRPSDKINKTYHRGNIENSSNGMKVTPPIFQNLSFATKQQNYGPSHFTDIERLIILIKYQNRRVYHNSFLANLGYFSRKISELQQLKITDLAVNTFAAT